MLSLTKNEFQMTSEACRSVPSEETHNRVVRSTKVDTVEVKPCTRVVIDTSQTVVLFF